MPEYFLCLAKSPDSHSPQVPAYTARWHVLQEDTEAECAYRHQACFSSKHRLLERCLCQRELKPQENNTYGLWCPPGGSRAGAVWRGGGHAPTARAPRRCYTDGAHVPTGSPISSGEAGAPSPSFVQLHILNQQLQFPCLGFASLRGAADDTLYLKGFISRQTRWSLKNTFQKEKHLCEVLSGKCCNSGWKFDKGLKSKTCCKRLGCPVLI